MKKIIYYIALNFIIFSCAKNESKENKCNYATPNYTIVLSLKKNHQFLREYKRFLTTISSKNTTISTIELQPDIGAGANSYLYDQSNSFLLVDCNGNWYSIDKKNGNIIFIGNFWKKKISYDYLGTFLLENHNHEITFKKKPNPSLEDIYIYGGG